MPRLLPALLLSGLLAGLLPPAHAQTPAAETRCLLLPLAPAERAQAATLVVEAEVLSQRSFRGTDGRHLFTASTLRVYKLLKGQWTPEAPLTVVTEGGTLGDEQETLTNTLQLRVGEQGLLFLTPAQFRGAALPGAWAAYASEQGFVRYDLLMATAAEPFRQYPLLDEAFYQSQTSLTQQPLRVLAPNAALSAAVARRQLQVQYRGVNAPLITDFSPRALVAGADSVLTISGTGFGASAGSVEFRNANDGGSTFTRASARDVISWADNRIQVRVPSYSSTGNPAGSGTIRVVTADQQQTVSLLGLTVRYALTNVAEVTSGITYRPVLIDQNNRGGYTFQADPAFAQNAAAVASFGRALTSWRCQTAVNWDLGAARTARGIASDGVNAVEFDQGNELPERVLGRTTNYNVGCRDANGQVRFWSKEIDMQFDDAISWQFGPAVPTGSQFDFETVALHELGHAQQLNHVIAPLLNGTPQLVMHYAIGARQVTRQLNFGRDVLAGYAVQLASLLPVTCGPAPEQPAPLTGPLRAQAQNGQVQLSWNGANECSGAVFVLESSPDATTWTSLAQLPAIGPGGGTTTYDYTDPRPLSGLRYYRLLIRLPNGLSLPTAPLGLREAGSPPLLVYPNPVAGTLLNLEYNAAATGNLDVRLYDALGRYCGGQRLSVAQVGVNQLGLPLPALRAGWYVLRWDDGTQRGSVPFVRVE